MAAIVISSIILWLIADHVPDFSIFQIWTQTFASDDVMDLISVSDVYSMTSAKYNQSVQDLMRSDKDHGRS